MKKKKEVSNSMKFLRVLIDTDEKESKSAAKSNESSLRSFLGDWKENKIIILTDNVQNVNRLIERDAFDGNMIINVDVKRPVDLALDIIRIKAAKNGDLYSVSLIDNNYGASLVENIFRNSNKWTFCPEESICRRTMLEVLDNINLLRLNSPNDEFEKSKKGKDHIAKKNSELAKMCEEYERVLKENKLYDEALAYKVAIEIIDKKEVDVNNELIGGAIIKTIFFEDARPSLQDIFIKKLFNDKKIENINTNDIVKGENCNFTFKKCYGLFTEVYEVLKDIQKNKIKFGDVALLYTDDAYVRYIKMIFAENNINVNVQSGYSALSNDYLKLIIDILKFARNDFLYKDLKKVVFNRLIKDSINYDDKNKNEEENGEEKAVDENNKDKFEKYKKEQLKIAYVDNISKLGFSLEQYEDFVVNKKVEYTYFATFLDELINVFKTESDSNNANLLLLYNKLLSFSDKWTTNKSKEKNIIKAKLKDLSKSMELYGDVEDFKKALDILIDELSIIRLSDEEKDNEIIASKFSGYKIINRKHIYIMGLAAKFNVSGTESPLLLDEERKKYYDFDENLNPKGHSVQIRSAAPIKSSEDLLKTVKAFRNSKVYISTPYYDILGNIDLAESPLYVKLLNEYGGGKDERIERYDNIINCEYKFNNDRFFQDNPNKKLTVKGKKSNGKKSKEKALKVKKTKGKESKAKKSKGKK